MNQRQAYPFDIRKFPDDDDILLDESDLERKNVVFCRREILEQMKCTQFAKVVLKVCVRNSLQLYLYSHFCVYRTNILPKGLIQTTPSNG